MMSILTKIIQTALDWPSLSNAARATGGILTLNV
jgi:hypothetical protein